MNVVVQGVKVTEGNLPEHTDLLIGMDVITIGDFVITNFEGKTKMSFGIPSSHSYDYAETIKDKNEKINSKRKCNCGSGKKYIYCHGKNEK